MERKIKKKMAKILKKTGASTSSQANKDAEAFKYLGNSKNLEEFNQWFVDSIDDDNCLTPEELAEYERLQAKGLVPAEEDLDKELSKYFVAPTNTLTPFDDTFLESKRDEHEELLHELKTMKEFKTQLLEDEKEKDVELMNTKLDLKSARQTLNDNVKKVYKVKDAFNKQFEEFKRRTSEVKDELSQLTENLLSEETQFKNSAASFQSFNSTMKSTQEQYLMQMDFSKYESLNTAFVETLDSKIKSEIDKNKRGETGDFVSSSACTIPFHGLTIDVKKELKRLNKSLSLAKQEKLEAEAQLMGLNKAIAHAKMLDRDLRTAKWKPTLSELKVDNVGIAASTEELTRAVSITKQDVGEHCQEWSDCLKDRAVKDLTVSRIARKNFWVKNLDEVLAMLLTREAHNLFLLMSLDQEKQRTLARANMITEIWTFLNSDANDLRDQKVLIERNRDDYMEYMARPSLERCEMMRRLASLMKVEVSGLTVAAKLLQNQIKTYEILLPNKYAEQVQSLYKMRNSLRPLKQFLFSGPANNAIVVNYNFYSEVQKLEERIEELSCDVCCVKMEFNKTKNAIRLNPSQRQAQLLWVKFFVRPDTLAVAASGPELTEEKPDIQQLAVAASGPELTEEKPDIQQLAVAASGPELTEEKPDVQHLAVAASGPEQTEEKPAESKHMQNKIKVEPQ